MLNRFLTGWLTSVLVVVMAVSAEAHPFHISTAELEVNAKTGRLEVGLKIQAPDLELAVTKFAGKRIRLDDSSESNAWLEKYLNKHFYFTSVNPNEAKQDSPPKELLANAGADKSSDQPSAEERSKLKLAGSESEKSWMWIYFELELPENLLGVDKTCTLVNTLLIDETDGQINTIQLRSKLGRQALRTSARHRSVAVQSKWLSKANASAGLSEVQ